VDPLFGPQVADADPVHDDVFAFAIGTATALSYKTVPGLTRFIRTDGSLYVFLPGIQGLINLSKGTIPQPTTTG